MKIKDINGREIEITDLHLALLQADDYRNYRSSNPEAAGFNERQQAYWDDVYHQLLKLAEAGN